jgi:hypothetical protein
VGPRSILRPAEVTLRRLANRLERAENGNGYYPDLIVVCAALVDPARLAGGQPGVTETPAQNVEIARVSP